MIQIDDAGWGSLVGGMLIGACRVESPKTQHEFVEIHVSAFQGTGFELKTYHYLAAEAAETLMKRLRVPPEEPILMCTGYVLDGAYDRLVGNIYNVRRGKVGEPLQTLIESAWLQHIQTLGVETDLETLTEKQGLYFWQCVKWLKGGDLNGPALPAREKLCKTGWGTFRIWADHPYHQAKELARQHKLARQRERRPW